MRFPRAKTHPGGISNVRSLFRSMTLKDSSAPGPAVKATAGQGHSSSSGSNNGGGDDSMLSPSAPPREYIRSVPTGIASSSLSTLHARLDTAYTEPLLPSRHNFPRGPSPSANYFTQPHQYSQPTVHTPLLDNAALREADRRARRRFISTWLYALGIWMLLGLITGGIAADAVQRGNARKHPRHHAGDWSQIDSAASVTGI